MIDAKQTRMFAEAAEASDAVARQQRNNGALVADLAEMLRCLDPQLLFTCARGSSDHAATFAKYLFETRLRLPTLSQAPSISSIYGGPMLHMKGQPFLLISQAGKSPDLLMSAEAAQKAGARVIALVNDTASPLAQMAEFVVPLHAGPETSVAATKSYIATLAALTQIAAAWTGDAPLHEANARLPEQLVEAWEAEWCNHDLFGTAQSLFVLGRGLTLGIAQEAALKFKETSGIHAEAFSAAEVAHGPMALVKQGFPLLIFPPLDKAIAGFDTIIGTCAARGAQIAVAGGDFPDTVRLTVPSGLHPATAPIVMIQPFYRMINALAVQRGYDPDHPPSLNKVTETR